MSDRKCEFSWKEPKLELPDEEETDNSYQRTITQSPQNASLIGEKVPKEEPDETDSTDLFRWSRDAKKPKIESDSPPSKRVPIWKPAIPSLTDFLQDDSEDFECDMSLGSSILFDRNPSSSSCAHQKINRSQRRNTVNFDNCYSDEKKEKEEVSQQTKQNTLFTFKKPTRATVKQALNKYFEENNHPTAAIMQNFAENLSMGYLTVFDHLEKRRREGNIHCEKDDPCERIKGFIAQSKEAYSRPELSPEQKRLVNDILNKHVESGKVFSIGYVHITMERVNLPERYLQRRFWDLRKTFLKLTPDNWKRRKIEEQNSLLPIETLRQLEAAYLHKKYQFGEEEWGPKDIKSLAAQVELDEETVKNWVEKRKNAVHGLQNDDDDMKSRRKLNKKIF